MSLRLPPDQKVCTICLKPEKSFHSGSNIETPLPKLHLFKHTTFGENAQNHSSLQFIVNQPKEGIQRISQIFKFKKGKFSFFSLSLKCFFVGGKYKILCTLGESDGVTTILGKTLFISTTSFNSNWIRTLFSFPI